MTPAPKRRWSFSLRMLFVVVLVVALASSTIRPLMTWLYPPESNFDELFRLIQGTVTAESSGPVSPPTWEYGAGQHVED
jgi:hypothetical protein